MADEDDDEDGAAEGEEHSGGDRKKLLIIVGAGVFLLIAAGAGVYFSGLLDSLLGHKKETAEATPSANEGETKSATKSGGQTGTPATPSTPVGPVAFFDVPEMVVTMNTSARSKAAFMKIHIMLELPSSGDVPRVQLALPRIVDNLQPYLRELRVEELKGSPGAYRLKEEMLTRIRAAVAPTQVNSVLLKDLQIQ